MFPGGGFSAFMLALRGALSDSIPLAATAAGSAGTGQTVARGDHAHRLPAYPLENLVFQTGTGGNPLYSVASATANTLFMPGYALAANTLGISDSLYLEMAGSFTGNAQARTVTLRIGANADGAGLNTTIFSLSSSSAAVVSWGISILLRNRGVRNSQLQVNYFTLAGGISQTVPILSIDFGALQYIGLTCSSADASAITCGHVLMQVQRG